MRYICFSTANNALLYYDGSRGWSYNKEEAYTYSTDYGIKYVLKRLKSRYPDRTFNLTPAETYEKIRM